METMKKSFIFAAVAAMFMVSCKQVEIDSNAGKLDQTNEGKTVIGVEIVSSKTVLGIPDDNAYPVNWQEGDAICVNSYDSRALTSSDFSGKTATFTFDQELTSPYWAVYPASAAMSFETEGAMIDVPSTQYYVAGSFDPAAAIMLGTGTDKISLVHAMAYIKVKTTGSATAKISRIEVTSLGTEKLSGEFMTEDFETLVVDPLGKQHGYAALSFDDPVAVGTDAIIAIPAQTYASGFMITIQDTDGKIMQKKSEKSFAAAPGHMYAVTLEYAPVAVEGTITIDGSLDDWKFVPAVTYSLPSKHLFPCIVKMRYTADDDYVYGYFEMDESYPSYSTYFDLFVDSDGNTATGGKLTNIEGYSGVPYTDSGLEWYIEGGVYNPAAEDGHTYVDWLAKYKYTGVDGDGIFTGLNNVTSTLTYNDFSLIGISDNTSKIGKFEFRMSRETFGLYGTKAAFGAKNLINGVAGLIPQGKSTGSDFARIPMAPIAMKESSHKPEPPQPEPEEPITIDGSFDDWAAAEGVQSYTTPAGALLSGAYEMKYVASEDYLYVYLDAMDNTTEGKPGGVTLDFFIDSDANPLTGMFVNNQLGKQEGSLFTTSGIDWYMQSNLYSGLNHFNLVNPGYFMECTGGFGKRYGEATVVQRGNHGTKEATSDKTYAKSISTDDGHILLEWKLSREFLKMTGPQARFGVRYMCPGTTNVGVMPQKPAEDGRFIAADMFTVNLPSKETPKPAVVEPIEIDGSFEDWEEAKGVATYDVPEDGKYTKLYTMKAVASDKYLYVYANAEGNLGVYTRAYLVLDTDADSSTGFNLLQGGDKIVSGGEYYIDTQFNQNGTYINQTAPSAAYLWNGGNNVTWDAANAIDKKALFNMNVSYGRTVYVGTDLLVEWRLDRKTCGVTGTKVGIGLRYQHGWGCVGACPQKSAVSGVYAPDVWHIDIPAIAE